MSRPILDFLLRRPDADESPWIRLAMLGAGLLGCAAGCAAAAQGHWAAIPCFAFGGLVLYAWWATSRGAASRELVRLSEKAAQQLQQMIDREAEPHRTCLRLRLDGDRYDVGFATTHDPQHEQVVEHRGVRVIILREQAALLRGMEVDFAEVAGHGKGFVFRRAPANLPGGD